MNTANKLEAFLRTVETGSFTKAGEMMNYSQSGISHMIKDLESEWGLVLLERDRGGVRITSDGIELLSTIRQVCNDLSLLQKKLDEIAGLETGLIRIGSFVSAAIQWLPKIIKRFHEDFPGVKYELKLGSYEDLTRMLQEGTLDCAFLPLSFNYKFDFIFLERDQYYVIMPKGHPLASYKKVPYVALINYPFFLVKSKNDSEVEEYLKKNNVKVSTLFTTWDDYVTMAMVSSGLGISILSETILKSCPFELEKRELDVPLTRDLGLVVRDKKNTSVAVKRFIEYLDCRNDSLADM